MTHFRTLSGSRLNSLASALGRTCRGVADSLHALRLEAQLPLKMWLEALLRTVSRPRALTILDSSAWEGWFPPIGALPSELHRLRLAQSRSPLSDETKRQFAARARRAAAEARMPTPLP